MNNIEKPVAFLVGQGGMPVQCATMLVANGFEVGAIHSPDAPLRDWAEQHNANYYAEFREFRNAAETTGCDYLFSVMNFRILPASLIASPRMFAVNYHDAPLPRYAGSHATAWALLQSREVSRCYVARHDRARGRRRYSQAGDFSAVRWRNEGAVGSAMLFDGNARISRAPDRAEDRNAHSHGAGPEPSKRTTREAPILPNLPDNPYDMPWRTTSGQRDGSVPCC